MGYAYTEKIADSEIEFLIQEAADNALIIEDDNPEELFAGSDSYAGKLLKTDMRSYTHRSRKSCSASCGVALMTRHKKRIKGKHTLFKSSSTRLKKTDRN